jgi:steroid delta-isomerase-like uncharacterized protein
LCTIGRMSRELIEQYYRAFNAEDYAGMLALLSDDVTHDVNQGEREVGKARFIAFLKHMEECYSEQLENVVIMGNPEGTRFAAEFVVHGKYLVTDAGLPAASGQSYKLPAGAFLDVANGRITRVTTYYNLQDWLKQVGAT